MLKKLTIHTLLATITVGLFAFTWQATSPGGSSGPTAARHASAGHD